MKFKIIATLLIFVGLIVSPVFAKKDKTNPLPPGLQKKAEKGKPLPPGWQKKLVKGKILDDAVYNRGHIVVPVDSHGLITIRVEGKIVQLINATREIVEILQ